MNQLEKKANSIFKKIKCKFPNLKVKLTIEEEDGFTDYYIVVNDENIIRTKKFWAYLTPIYNMLNDRFIHIYADKYLFEDECVTEDEYITIKELVKVDYSLIKSQFIPQLVKNSIWDTYCCGSNINMDIQNKFALARGA
ncbi:MAG: hypothetical protein WC614_13195 [bacterium]